MPKLPKLSRLPSVNLLSGNRRRVLILRVAILVAIVGITGILTFTFINVSNGSQPLPKEPADLEQGAVAEQAEEEVKDSIDTDDDTPGREHAFSKQQLETMFSSPANIRQEAEALLGDMGVAIEKMDELLAVAEAADLESCDLLQSYLEIDLLVLANKKGDLARRAVAFLAASKQGILGSEFNLAIDEGILEEDFDYTEIDASVLTQDFDTQASTSGRELKEEIIKLRQRSKKISSQTHRLDQVNAQYELLDPNCSLMH